MSKGEHKPQYERVWIGWNAGAETWCQDGSVYDEEDRTEYVRADLYLALLESEGKAWDSAIDHHHHAFRAGVRAGLEAAAKAVDDTEVVTYSQYHTHDDGDATLGAAARAIRALDPASVSPAGALREKGTKT